MVCPKCKKELDDNAVFCENCGSFVMKTELHELPNDGLRVRKKSRVSMIILTVIAVTAVSVFSGIGIGYMIMHRDFLERESQKYADNAVKNPREVWEESLTSNILNYKNNSAYYRNSAE